MKTYYDLPEMFADGLFKPSDILVFWGKRGTGKSSLMAFFDILFMQRRNAKIRLKQSKAICDELNMAGFNFKPPNDHLVFVNTYVESKGPGIIKSKAYSFSELNFALPNKVHQAYPIVPCGVYSIDEGQDVFDSHKGALPTFLSKLFELSRQIELFIMLALQRFERLPLDIKDLATFVIPAKYEEITDKYGRIIAVEWIVDIIYSYANVTAYMDTWDKKYVDKRVKFASRWNMRVCYNHRYFIPLFYQSFENQAFMLEKCEELEYSPQGFEKFKQLHTIDIPETFRGKKKRREKCES